MSSVAEDALAKPEIYESQRIRLTSQALHIGSEAQKLSPFEYVVTDKFVYLPDADALAKALRAKDTRYLNQYIDRIEQRQSILSLLEDALGENWQHATSPDGRMIFSKQRRSLRQTEQAITDLRPMMRNGLGQIYIPGSSIKGAIRTAIAYHLLKQGDAFQVPKSNRVSAIEQRLQKTMGSLRQKAKVADDALFMDALFSDFELAGDRSAVKNGPNTDLMRAVKVSDTKPLIERKVPLKDGKHRFENLAVTAEVLVSSRFPDYRAKYRASIYAELARTVQTTFTITLDRALLNRLRHQQGMQIPFDSVADILQLCQAFAQDQWDAEHDYWQDVQNHPSQRDSSGTVRNLDFSAIRDFYQPTTCPYSLRLGWGSGMNGTGVGLLLDEQLRSQLRDTCGIKAPGFEAPKSRRTILDPKGDIRFAPGWVKFKAV
jgi:CRISPR-associated protein Csm5